MQRFALMIYTLRVICRFAATVGGDVFDGNPQTVQAHFGEPLRRPVCLPPGGRGTTLVVEGARASRNSVLTFPPALSLTRLRRERLAAARSRLGSDSTPVLSFTPSAPLRYLPEGAFFRRFPTITYYLFTLTSYFAPCAPPPYGYLLPLHSYFLLRALRAAPAPTVSFLTPTSTPLPRRQ